MTCPLYSANPVSHCDAVADEVTPTLHEREHFCQCDGYTHCPTLRTMLRLGRPLREAEYFENWLPPAART